MRHKALVIAYGVHETGRREVVGIDVGEAETEAFWREFLRSLRSRGLAGVALCVSDAHEGLKAAVACSFCATRSPMSARAAAASLTNPLIVLERAAFGSTRTLSLRALPRHARP